MPNYGTIPCNLHTVDRDETVYRGVNHTDAKIDTIALRRQLSVINAKTKVRTPTKANTRFERAFPIGTTGESASVVVSIATVVPPGVDPAAVATYVETSVAQAATKMKDIAITGDIHLD